MQRRFFLREKRAPHAWQRVLVRLLVLPPLVITLGAVIFVTVMVVREMLDW